MTEMFTSPQGPCFADLRGKVALVTGGGAGIGRGISQRLAVEGMHVIICGRTASALRAMAERIRGTGGQATAIVTDISNEEEVCALFSRIREEHGRLDVLVHNAALNKRSALEDCDTDYWRQVFATNIDSAFFLAKQYTDLMLPQGHGNMIFISTIGAQRAHYGMLAYDSSKGALDAFTRGLALELALKHIRVNAVAPGTILNRDLSNDPDANWAQSHQSAFEAQIPLDQLSQPLVPMGRFGTPAEVGAAVAFLASEQSSYITGQVLTVDGGATTQLSPRGQWI